MPKEYFKKKGQSNSFKMSNPYSGPFKHFVDDNPEHQDTYGEDHSGDLQTEREHLANKNVPMQKERRAKKAMKDTVAYGKTGRRYTGTSTKEGTRTHWPDGTERTEREIFEWDETKTEEAGPKYKSPAKQQLDPNLMTEQGGGGSLGGGMSAVPPVDPNAPMGGAMLYKSPTKIYDKPKGKRTKY